MGVKMWGKILFDALSEASPVFLPQFQLVPALLPLKPLKKTSEESMRVIIKASMKVGEDAMYFNLPQQSLRITVKI